MSTKDVECYSSYKTRSIFMTNGARCVLKMWSATLHTRHFHDILLLQNTWTTRPRLPAAIRGLTAYLTGTATQDGHGHCCNCGNKWRQCSCAIRRHFICGAAVGRLIDGRSFIISVWATSSYGRWLLYLFKWWVMAQSIHRHFVRKIVKQDLKKPL